MHSDNPDQMITTEKRGHVFLIGLNRVKERNAMNMDMLLQFSDAFTQLEDDPELRVGVVYANGKQFTLGLDLPDVSAKLEAAGRLPIPETNVDPWNIGGRLRTKPVVTAVHGMTFTLGIELLLASDVGLAATRTMFAQLEVQRGIMPFGGATIRFMKAAGWSNAMRYILTGDDFDAPEALRIGLISEIVEKPKLLDRAVEIAQRIAEQAPLAVVATRNSALQALREGEEAAKKDLLPTVLSLMKTEDAEEGKQSFIEKRKAVYKGK